VTIGDWLESRTVIPAELAAQLRVRLVADLGADAAELPGRSLAAAERALVELLDHGETGRSTAIDLLTVDALVTYAFESAARDPHRARALADASMSRLSAVVGAQS
jgi:hypothetical protein